MTSYKVQGAAVCPDRTPLGTAKVIDVEKETFSWFPYNTNQALQVQGALHTEGQQHQHRAEETRPGQERFHAETKKRYTLACEARCVEEPGDFVGHWVAHLRSPVAGGTGLPGPPAELVITADRQTSGGEGGSVDSRKGVSQDRRARSLDPADSHLSSWLPEGQTASARDIKNNVRVFRDSSRHAASSLEMLSALHSLGPMGL
ncbi:unnamed protein product [Boreogadus saida]